MRLASLSGLPCFLLFGYVDNNTQKRKCIIFQCNLKRKKKIWEGLGTRLVRGPQSGGMRTNGLNWNGLTSCNIVILFLTGE